MTVDFSVPLTVVVTAVSALLFFVVLIFSPRFVLRRLLQVRGIKILAGINKEILAG